jgi:hypothetical protein
MNHFTPWQMFLQAVAHQIGAIVTAITASVIAYLKLKKHHETGKKEIIFLLNGTLENKIHEAVKKHLD